MAASHVRQERRRGHGWWPRQLGRRRGHGCKPGSRGMPVGCASQGHEQGAASDGAERRLRQLLARLRR
jgi:hypothetical protein